MEDVPAESGRAEGEREAVGVVEHQHASVVLARRLGVEAEVGLVEAARPLPVVDRERKVLPDCKA